MAKQSARMFGTNLKKEMAAEIILMRICVQFDCCYYR